MHPVMVWDASTGAELITLKGHTDYVTWATLSPDGSRIVTGCQDFTAKVWDAGSGAELITLEGLPNKDVPVSFSKDGSRIFSRHDDQRITIWDATPVNREVPPRGHDSRSPGLK
jgi:WD40 repeat protein